jgi:hypothetical protein
MVVIVHDIKLLSSSIFSTSFQWCFLKKAAHQVVALLFVQSSNSLGRTIYIGNMAKKSVLCCYLNFQRTMGSIFQNISESVNHHAGSLRKNQNQRTIHPSYFKNLQFSWKRDKPVIN